MHIFLKINTLIRLSVLILTLGLTIDQTGLGQSGRSRKSKETNDWVQNLWFGGGINLGFSSDAFNSYFGLGVSPLAGYKLTPFFSIGPRLSLDWTVAKISDGFRVYNYNSVDFGLGVFARFKFLKNFFTHLEYSQLNETYAVINGSTLEKERQWRGIALLGLGYNSNELWGYEIYVNYDFLEDPNSVRLPIVYRFGITYNF